MDLRELRAGKHPGDADDQHRRQQRQQLPVADGRGAPVCGRPHVDYIGEEEITVARLDDVAPEHLASATKPFLKIDTQGFEREVLAGGAQTLETCVGLQLELSFVPLYSGGMLVDEAISFAYDQGFRMVAVAQGFTEPERGEGLLR